MGEYKERLSKFRQVNKLSIEPPFPSSGIMIELTNVCNHKCIFCANRKTTAKYGYMNFDFFKRISKEIYDNGGRECGLYVTGEPLLYPKIQEAAAHLKKLGFEYVFMDTNGALAAPERIIPLIKRGVGIDSIKFSINAGSRETYRFIHGKDDFDLVINNLKFIDEYRKANKLDLKLYVSFIVTKQTVGEVSKFKSEIGKYCDEIDFAKVNARNGLNVKINDLLFPAGNFKDVGYYLRKLPCERLFNGLTVTYEGYLSPCCGDFYRQLIIADLNKVSIKQAWTCEKFKNL
ncbi:MAG: radical SAM protein, partial [Elusimicrobiota bacterium]|nr:radical SAM protein [Elusimicrobiota bacterium]